MKLNLFFSTLVWCWMKRERENQMIAKIKEERRESKIYMTDERG